MFKVFLFRNAFAISTTSFSIRFLTTTITSDSNSFTVSYLIHKFGFSHEFALKASKQLYFKTSQKPDSVLNFFKNHGFTDSHIRNVIKREPWLLSCDTQKRILPKFQFLLSIGASSSDIVHMVRCNPKFLELSLKNNQIKFEYFLSKGASSSHIISLLTSNPQILQSSLDKRIIPLFELLRMFFKTNKDTIVCLIRHSKWVASYPHHLIVANINLMSDFGVSHSVIARLLQIKPSIFCSKDLIKSLEEVKGLGFHPPITTFGAALIAKKGMSKKLWDEKVDVFKKWGWSDEDVIRAFRGRPDLLLTSIDKINLVMSFWVNQLGWDSLALAKRPHIFSYSLEKRIIPRASVLQYLVMKGLRKKNASLVAPFDYSGKMFLSKFVFSFKEESDYLLKLYEEK
ncbi:putative transcription regulator mTERF family [Medicago truncatula]|uniref:Putative transcription regulator mTERF family n=2 Tax=Medicago truncatula TaxID=3880 RepID=A0A072V7I2_MEDTR|nr:mTERF protein [Medicago truncatula]RHN73230.1 putative transcription regulator mTERF family [Medicago truncatula]